MMAEDEVMLLCCCFLGNLTDVKKMFLVLGGDRRDVDTISSFVF